jgi:hypothetical protein
MKRLVIAALVLAPGIAFADPAAHDDYGAKSRVSATLGLATPTGSLGVEYAHALHPNLELALGAGMGFSGPQLSVMPRLRAGSGPVSFSLGAGVSGGPFEVFEICFDCEDEMETKANTLWANVEAGLQITTHGGTAVRMFGGLGHVVAYDSCSGPHCSELEDNYKLPYAGISIGRTF